MTKTNVVTDIIAEVKRISTKLGIEPVELSKVKFLINSEPPMNPRQLERAGGYKNIVLDYFGKDDQRDLAVLYGSTAKRRYLSKLERIVGSSEYLYKHLSKIVCAELNQFKFPIPARVKKPHLKTDGREIIAFVSDTHFGIEIDDDELGGVNKYNWTIAARRMGLFAMQVATFKKEVRHETSTLRLCLGGDLAQGLIHLSDSGTDLITHQVIGTVHILYQFISYLRHFFKEIKVECTTDNHLRMVHKGPNRASAQKYDSYATMIHHALAMGFKHCPDVNFNIPLTPYTTFNILGNNFYMTHGDTIINVGYPGRRINTEGIANAANRLNASLKDKNEYRVIMVGHVHTPVFITLDNGTELVINGTGSGVDPYAQSIGIFESHPAQVIFESTPSFPVGDQRKVFLKKADNDASYEEIIKPYAYELSPKTIEIPKAK